MLFHKYKFVNGEYIANDINYLQSSTSNKLPIDNLKSNICHILYNNEISYKVYRNYELNQLTFIFPCIKKYTIDKIEKVANNYKFGLIKTEYSDIPLPIISGFSDTNINSLLTFLFVKLILQYNAHDKELYEATQKIRQLAFEGYERILQREAKSTYIGKINSFNDYIKFHEFNSIKNKQKN